MDKKTVEQKAQDLAYSLSKRPSTYIWLVRLINKLALLGGLLLLPINWIKSKVNK